MLEICVILVLTFLSFATHAAQYSVYGKVKMIRLHQYLTNKGWDENIWFCLDTKEIVGKCSAAWGCDGHMGLSIDKNAQPHVYSTVLAARLSQTSIKVRVDDSFMLNDSNYCYARIIDL